MHEHDKRVLFSVLSHVSSHLNVEQLNHLITKVHSLPVRDYDVQALELVNNLTIFAIKANVLNYTSRTSPINSPPLPNQGILVSFEMEWA